MEKAKSLLIALISINCFQLILAYDDTNFLNIVPHIPSININQICKDVFVEPRAFPGNNQFFIVCIRGHGIILQCYENETFDVEYLKCMNNNHEETTESVTTTTTTIHPPDDDLCKGRDFEFINHPNDCGKAIFCFRGEALLRECNEGSIFDLLNQQCRYGDRETCLFNEDFPTTTVPIETTTRINVDEICNGLNFVFLEHPHYCTKAIFCFQGNAIISSCPDNQIFDIEIENCRPGDTYLCEFNDDMTTTQLPTYEDMCYGKNFNFIEHPSDCSRAIFCFNSVPILRTCPENQIFDISIENCRDGNRENCSFNSRRNNINPCEGLNENALIPHEIDLRKYYQCASGAAFTMKCDFNRVFDVNHLKCI